MAISLDGIPDSVSLSNHNHCGSVGGVTFSLDGSRRAAGRPSISSPVEMADTTRMSMLDAKAVDTPPPAPVALLCPIRGTGDGRYSSKQCRVMVELEAI